MTPSKGYQGVAMDTHIYQMFSNAVRHSFFCLQLGVTNENIIHRQQVALSNSQHIASACSHANELSHFNLWIVVGEWTPAATDCGTFFKGFLFESLCISDILWCFYFYFSQVLERTWGRLAV
jgi:glucan 1,3-beta-glucosidase